MLIVSGAFRGSIRPADVGQEYEATDEEEHGGEE
jgi:hypothetical protein